MNVRRDGEQTLLMGVSMNMRALSGEERRFFDSSYGRMKRSNVSVSQKGSGVFVVDHSGKMVRRHTMFLKRLDVIGFKSFADRVSIEFVPGVTAVVGPNGSGKSNITDAIRWVLGEQSAKSLRGAKMEDVIFAGSESRKPLNVAEVTITLDNEDGFLPLEYQEVSVTRRVYRSGESEFFINRQPCRLKDIVDLFLDSGLGKEAFSIIGQGRVEEILSSKPEERRTSF
ncbi:hypothetical protein DI43_04635 [Geobacillus sp. CAMR12739]|nr:hypothetical protein DI43_04635 [Geobacillus sp. CAMR12739]